MTFETSISNRSYQCRCGGAKIALLCHYENGQATMWKEIPAHEAASYRGSKTDAVEQVWCKDCGLLYHPSSV